VTRRVLLALAPSGRGVAVVLGLCLGGVSALAEPVPRQAPPEADHRELPPGADHRELPPGADHRELPPEPALADLDAKEIARRAEDVLRSDGTYMQATMTVTSPRLSSPRKVRFQSWDDRRSDRAFIRILSPPKDEDSTFLRIPPNLWTYVPRVERTMRIPPSMMLQPWMGSDFTNDDLVNESSDVDDYDHRLLGIEEVDGEQGLRAFVVEYVPHEETPVVWGKIVTWIEVEHATPLRQDFHDEDGVLVRSMQFERIREVQARRVPHVWVMRPVEKKGHETRVQLEEIRFDQTFDEEIFTTRNLKRRR
jgi:outer membrane lipoprotein-sorting protein